MKKTLAVLLASLLSLAPQALCQAITSAQMRFVYTVPADAQTSAGVFDSTGALVRTLWSGQLKLAGTYSYLWDGKNDAGSAVSAGNYQIKVLQNNETAAWDGPIGFTSNDWTKTANTWSYFGYPASMKFCQVGDVAWIAGGYSEGVYGLGWLQANNPNTPHILSTNYNNQSIEFAECDTDGQHLYLLNEGGNFATATYVTVFDAVSGMPTAFTNGTPIINQGTTTGYANTTLSTTDNGTFGTANPTGLAVQRSGSLLAVAHGNFGTPPAGSIDTVRFFNKTTGAATGTNLSITNPQAIAFSSAGLWVVSNGTLKLDTDPGNTNTVTTPITGLSNPVYVATNGATNHVFVLDGGTSQQMKEYDASYNLVRTYGVLGGYTDQNPNITNARLNLDNTALLGTGTVNSSWVKVADTNDVWIGDGGTAHRILHISPSNAYVAQIQWTNPNYAVAVDHVNPTRVFMGMFEYSVNYGVPNLPGDPAAAGGNGSWQLVRNWGVSNPLPVAMDPRDAFQSVQDLSNGRTYAIINSLSNNQVQYEVELPSGTAPMRYTGNQVGQFASAVIEPDGSLMGISRTGTTPNFTFNVTKQSLTGFNGSGNPQRSAAVTVASVLTNAATDTQSVGGWGGGPNPWPSTAGVYPVYDAQSTSTAGFPHLAGMVNGRSTYLFETHREAVLVYPGTGCAFSQTAGFGGHAGIAAGSEGHHIFTGYDGQYATWGNAFCDYWDDGLLIQEFTQTATKGTASGNFVPPFPAGYAGNIGQFKTASVGSDIYLYLSNESGFSPIDRWHISNTGSIHEYGATGALGTSLTLSQLF